MSIAYKSQKRYTYLYMSISFVRLYQRKKMKTHPQALLLCVLFFITFGLLHVVEAGNQEGIYLLATYTFFCLFLIHLITLLCTLQFIFLTRIHQFRLWVIPQ